jgi:hypothetical protein
MSPHQSFPLRHRVPDWAQDWSAIRTNCYAEHKKATSSSNTGVFKSCALQVMQYTPTGCTAKHYAAASSSYSSHPYWSCSRLHGSPPTYRVGLPPDKNAGCPSSLNLPSGRSDPPDKEITYNCMNGSPGDPPGTVVQQSKKQMNRPFHNLSRGRSDRQGGRAGDNYRRYKTCH